MIIKDYNKNIWVVELLTITDNKNNLIWKPCKVFYKRKEARYFCRMLKEFNLIKAKVRHYVPWDYQ